MSESKLREALEAFTFSHGLCECSLCLLARAALAAPASPGPEPRAMEEIERLVVEAMSAAVAFVKKASEQDTPSLVQVHAQKTAVLAAIRRALEAAPAGAFQRGVEAAAKVLRGVVDSSEEDDRWDAIVAEAESQILDLARRGLPRSSPGAAPAEPLLTWDDLRNHTHSQVADLLVENPGHSVIAAEAASRLRSLGSALGAASPGERGLDSTLAGARPAEDGGTLLSVLLPASPEWLRGVKLGTPVRVTLPAAPPESSGRTIRNNAPQSISANANLPVLDPGPAPAPVAAPREALRCACGHFHGAGSDGEDEGCKDVDCPCRVWREAPREAAPEACLRCGEIAIRPIHEDCFHPRFHSFVGRAPAAKKEG